MATCPGAARAMAPHRGVIAEAHAPSMVVLPHVVRLAQALLSVGARLVGRQGRRSRFTKRTLARPMGTILLVDDDDDLRESIEGLLTEQGHEVTTARNGLDALDALDGAELPDVAVIDVFMPEMDGLELLERLRGDARLAALPVIVMSAATSV